MYNNRGETEPLNVRYEMNHFYKHLLKPKRFRYDEGGLVEDEDQHLIGGESQFNQGPFYAQIKKVVSIWKTLTLTMEMVQVVLS